MVAISRLCHSSLGPVASWCEASGFLCGLLGGVCHFGILDGFPGKCRNGFLTFDKATSQWNHGKQWHRKKAARAAEHRAKKEAEAADAANRQ